MKTADRRSLSPVRRNKASTKNTPTVLSNDNMNKSEEKLSSTTTSPASEKEKAFSCIVMKPKDKSENPTPANDKSSETNTARQSSSTPPQQQQQKQQEQGDQQLEPQEEQEQEVAETKPSNNATHSGRRGSREFIHQMMQKNHDSIITLNDDAFCCMESGLSFASNSTTSFATGSSSCQQQRRRSSYSRRSGIFANMNSSNNTSFSLADALGIMPTIHRNNVLRSSYTSTSSSFEGSSTSLTSMPSLRSFTSMKSTTTNNSNKTSSSSNKSNVSEGDESTTTFSNMPSLKNISMMDSLQGSLVSYSNGYQSSLFFLEDNEDDYDSDDDDDDSFQTFQTLQTKHSSRGAAAAASTAPAVGIDNSIFDSMQSIPTLYDEDWIQPKETTIIHSMNALFRHQEDSSSMQSSNRTFHEDSYSSVVSGLDNSLTTLSLMLHHHPRQHGGGGGAGGGGTNNNQRIQIVPDHRPPSHFLSSSQSSFANLVAGTYLDEIAPTVKVLYTQEPTNEALRWSTHTMTTTASSLDDPLSVSDRTARFSNLRSRDDSNDTDSLQTPHRHAPPPSIPKRRVSVEDNDDEFQQEIIAKCREELLKLMSPLQSPNRVKWNPHLHRNEAFLPLWNAAEQLPTTEGGGMFRRDTAPVMARRRDFVQQKLEDTTTSLSRMATTTTMMIPSLMTTSPSSFDTQDEENVKEERLDGTKPTMAAKRNSSEPSKANNANNSKVNIENRMHAVAEEKVMDSVPVPASRQLSVQTLPPLL